MLYYTIVNIPSKNSFVKYVQPPQHTILALRE